MAERASPRARRSARASLVALALVLALASMLGATPAGAAPSQRVIVVWLAGTSMSDWQASAGPALRSLMDSGAVGLVQTSPAEGGLRRAFAEAGANPELSEAALRPGGEREGLGESLTKAGRSAGVLGPSQMGPPPVDAMFGPETRRASAARGTMTIRDPNHPAGSRTDMRALALALREMASATSVVAVEVPDAAAVDARLRDDPELRARWTGRAIADSDVVIAEAVRSAGEDGTVIVLSAPGPASGESGTRIMLSRRGRALGAIAIASTRYGRGTLTSDTTRTDGLVSLIDVTPTVLRAAGLEPPSSLRGSAAVARNRGGAPAHVATLEADLAAAADERPQATVAVFLWLLAAAVAVAIVFGAGAGRAPTGRLPRTFRDLPLLMLMVAALSPAALLLREPALIAAAAAGAAITLRLIVGARSCVPVACFFGAAGPALAVAVAPAYAAATPAVDAIAAGLPPGVDPTVAYPLLSAVFVVAGLRADARRPAWPVTGAVLAAIAIAAWTMEPRAAPVAAAALAWFISRSAGWNLLRAGLLTASLATVGAAAFVLGGPEPFAYPSEARMWATSHLTLPGLEALSVVAVAPLALVALRKRALTGRALFGAPGLRAAAGAAAVLAVAVAIAYPGRPASAAWILLPAVSAWAARLLGAGAR